MVAEIQFRKYIAILNKRNSWSNLNILMGSDLVTTTAPTQG